MAAVYIRSMFLYDPTMETLAEFMLMEDATDPNGQWIKVIPTYKLYEMYKHAPENPIFNTLMPGMTMMRESFLSYLGNSANAGSKMSYPPVITSLTENGDTHLVLSTSLSIESVANLTGWDKEFIGEFFKDYLVFG